MSPITVTPTKTRGADLPTDQRMKLLDKLNATAGYTAAQTFFPPGTALVDVGEKNLRAHRAKTSALPTLTQFAADFAAWESARAPLDIKAKLGELRMRPDGYLVRPAVNKPLAMTETGLSQLVALHSDMLSLPRGISSTLAWLSPKARAEAFNDMATRAEPFLAREGADLPDRVYRTALDVGGQRYLRAVTSTKHVGEAGGYAAMVNSLARLFPNAKVMGTYCEDRMDLQVIFPMSAREIRVGDVLEGALSLTISETKDVTASVRDALNRVLCVNLTQAWYGKGTEFTRRHIGENFLRDLAARMVDGLERLQPFIEAFGDSYSNPFPAFAPTRPELVERAEKAFPELTALPAETVLSVWDVDREKSPGDTLAGLVAAYTRASQALAPSDSVAVEAVAGRLVVEGWDAIA